MAKRFAIGGFPQETNSWCEDPGTLEWFKSEGYWEGEEIFEFRQTNCVLGGILDAAESYGWEMVPTMVAGNPLGTGSGTVTKEAFDNLLGELVDRTKAAGPLDGVFVLGHGGMVSDEHLDGDGTILATMREAVGEGVPMATTYDTHGAISPLIVEKCDIVTAYDTYPHTDWYERGFESAQIMNLIVQGRVKVTSALRKPGILPNLPGEYSGAHPMASAFALAHKMEEKPGVLAVTVNGGYPYTDSPHAGLSIVVITDDDQRLADELADELDAFCWKEREGFVKRAVSVDDAIEEALTPRTAYREGPVVLADQGDSVGSHSPGDGTAIWRGLVDRGITNCAVGFLAHGKTAQCIKAGVGNKVTLTIGGRVDEPVEISGTVKVITDGNFDPPILRGRRDLHSFAMGTTALIRADGNDVVLSEKPCQFNFLHDWRHAGVEPLDKRIISVKSPVHYREHFEPVASKIIEVDTKGISPANLDELTFEHRPKPLYPFEDNFRK